MIPRIHKLPIFQSSFFLFGPRQVGKSTLVKSVLPLGASIEIDLLKRRDFLNHKTNPDLLAEEVKQLLSKKDKGVVFIDEIQKLPALLDEVHSLIETYKGRVFFILTGSSARKLKRSSANMLGGRAWKYFLFPLTHIELGDQFRLDEALLKGTLPPVVGLGLEEAFKTLNSYGSTYLKEEILDEAVVRDIRPFSSFLHIAADQSGQIVNYSTIARDTGVDSKTIRGYYQILEDTLIAFKLEPYLRSARKRLVKHSKYYLFDIGVINSLVGRVAEEGIRVPTTYGMLFEHFVILETHRLLEYNQKHFEMFHWRTSNGAEVDMVLKMGKKILAIEIKSSLRIRSKDLKGVVSFKECFPDAECICVSNCSRPYMVGEISVIPWRDLFGKEWLGLRFEKPEVRSTPSTVNEDEEGVRYGRSHLQFIHDFILPDVFEGRDEEIKRLVSIVKERKDPDTGKKPSVTSIRAIGGMGKSCLVRKVMEEIKTGRMKRDIVWFSFYEARTEDPSYFFREVLKRFDPEFKEEELSVKALREQLCQLADEIPVIFVIDGLEVIQKTENENIQHFGEIDEKSKEVLKFLTHLSNQELSIALITTRTPLKELSGMYGFLQIELKTLSDRAGANMLKALGVMGRDEELMQCAKLMGGHPLCLRAIGIYMAERGMQAIELEKITGDPIVFSRTSEGEKLIKIVNACRKELSRDQERFLRLLSLHPQSITEKNFPLLIQGYKKDGRDYRWVIDNIILPLTKKGLVETFTDISGTDISGRHTYSAHPLMKLAFSTWLDEKGGINNGQLTVSN